MLTSRLLINKTNATLLALVMSASTSACISKDDSKEDKAEIPESPMTEEPVAARQQTQDFMKVAVEVKDEGVELKVEEIPEGAELECEMGGTPLSPCHDGALFARPKPGEYKISIVAIRDGDPLSFGESDLFTVLPHDNGTGNQEVGEAPLNLVLSDQNFSNGQAVSIEQDFIVKFDFFKEPDPAQCQPELKCRYDSRTSPFWVDCDQGGKSFTIPKNLLAQGLQYLSVQAKCGERLGPELTVFWYGVPDGYQHLAIRPLKDQNNRYIFNLVKADDCPVSQQAFQCAKDADDEFALCEDANVLDEPAPGTRIRLVCSDQEGPEYVIE